MSERAHFAQHIRGWLYPPACGECEKPLTTQRQLARPFLCESCEASLERVVPPFCQICGQSYFSADAEISRCGNCADRDLAFDFATSAYRGAGVSRDLMFQFKYKSQVHLARLMASLLKEAFHEPRLREKEWIVIPVPLHRARERDRRFNQAREMADSLAKTGPKGISLTVVPLLRRTRETPRQASLDRRERLINLSGAFEVQERFLKKLPKTPNLLLLDDVITTGSTVSECAAVLRKSVDARKIAALSVLRG